MEEGLENMISVVIPCYKSQNYLAGVVDHIRSVIREMGEQHQIILVCDGSPDDTFEEIRRLCAEDRNIVGVNLTRNFGQPSARCAAVPYIRGEYVVFTDDDGEHPVEDIPRLIEKLKEGYDIVYAQMSHNTHSGFKQFGSAVNLFMMRMLLGMPKGVRPTSFFATKAFVAKSLLNYKSPSPYSIGYFLQVTRKVCNIDSVHHKRAEGTSNYSFSKMLKIWVDGFTGFSVVPLRFASLCGIVLSGFGFLMGLYVVVRKLIRPEILAGYSSIVAAIFFTAGLIMFMLGLLGEYIGRIFMSLNQLPQYVVREEINAGD